MRRRIPRKARWILDGIGLTIFLVYVVELVFGPGTQFLIRVLWLALLTGALAAGFAAIRLLKRRSVLWLDFPLVAVEAIIVAGNIPRHPREAFLIALAALSAVGAADVLRQTGALRRHRAAKRQRVIRTRTLTVTERPPSATRAVVEHPSGPGATAAERRPIKSSEFQTLLLVASADEARGERVQAALEEASISAERLVRQGEILDAVIILVSFPATQDPAWTEDALWWSDRPQRKIPISVGHVPRDAAPKPIRDINYILWDETEAGLASCIATIFTVLHSDLPRHRLLRGLIAEAGNWEAAGRRNELLIQDERRARQEYAAFTGPDAHEHLDATTRAFLDESLRHAERRRRSRLTWRLVIGALLFAAAFAAAVKVVELRDTASAQRLALPVALSSLGRSDPDIHAVQAAAVVLQGPHALNAVAIMQAREAFSEPWPYTVLGESNRWELNDATLINHDREALVVDSGYNLSAWTVPSGQPVWRRRLPAPAWAIDSNESGSTVVTAGPGKVQIVHGRTGSITPIAVAALTSPSGVTLDARGGTAAVTEMGEIFLVDLENGRIESRRRYAQVLTTGRADGDALHALVVENHHLAVVDIRSGSILRQGPVVTGDAVGALAPDGLAFAYSDDSDEVYFDPRGGPTRDVGVHVAEGVWGMAISPGGVLAIGDTAFAAQYVSLGDGTPLQAACSDIDGRLTIKIVSNLALCVGIDRIELEAVPQVPATTRPRSVPTGGVRATVGSYVLVGTTDGSVLLEQKRSHKVLAGLRRVVRGPVTAIHVIEPSPTVIVGSAAGDVAEMSFSATEHVGIIAWRWTVPDGAAVVGLTGTTENDNRTITAANGKRWTETSCGGCAVNDNILLGHVAYRFHRCLPTLNAKPIAAATMKVLRLTTCRTFPGATG